LPKVLRTAAVDELMARLERIRCAMAGEALDDARRKNEVCASRPVVRSADGKGHRVGTDAFDAAMPSRISHDRHGSCGSRNRRYPCDNPLIVQGPGAGPEVDAAGVFSDLRVISLRYLWGVHTFDAF